MDPTSRFIEMVNGPAAAIDLTEGWLLLGAHAAPDVDPEVQRARIADLADQCREPTLDGVRRLLFNDASFAGCRSNYYEPVNSLLHGVLDRREGLPISLSVLMIEVGRIISVPLDGVGMPGHFLVRDRVLQDVFVDPFFGGRMLDPGGCEQVFRSIAGAHAPFTTSYLDPIGNDEILGRMAANLVNAYRRGDDRRGLRWAARLRSGCPGVSPQETAQLAQAMAHTAAYDEATELFETAAGRLRGEDAERWRREAARVRSKMN